MRESRRAFAVAAAVYIILTALLVGLCINRNHGTFVYPLDDSYIHMAIAKNIVQHGVWGVSPHEFGNASSSPAYTILLSAIYLATGIHTWTPLLLNLALGLLFLYVFIRFVARWWPTAKWPLGSSAAILAVVVLPLPILTVIAMEHVLHALVVLLLFDAFLRSLSGVETNNAFPWRLPLLAAISMLVRYESAFVLLPMLLILAIRRRWAVAVITGVASAAAVLIVGLVFKHHGAEMLPNSVLVKSSVIFGRISGGDYLGAASFSVRHAYLKLLQEPLLAGICLLVGLLVIVRRSSVEGQLMGSNHPSRYPTWRVTGIGVFSVCVSAFLLHLLSSSPVWFFRYQSYVATLCCAGFGVALSQAQISNGWRRIAVTLLLTAVVVGSVARVGWGCARTVQGSQNIYQQQYQMAMFFREYYRGKPVAVNDIGAVSYFADTVTLDLYGLGSNKIASLKRAGKYGPREMETMCRYKGVEIAAIYDTWFPDLPKSWQRVGRWTICDNYVCGGVTVSFYATQPSAASELRGNLSRFRSKLPQGVTSEDQ